jgi:S1-C subfamily serine protease
MPRGKKTPDPEVVVEAEVLSTTTAPAPARGRNGTATRSRARPVVTEAVATPMPGPSLVALGLQTAILHEQLTALQRQVAEVTHQADEARAALQALRDDIARGLGRPEPPPSSPHRAASRPEPRAETPPEESKAETPPAPAPHRNRLGVTVGNGVVVAEVLPDSPAAAAGVARGDVIEEADGHGILSGTMLRNAVEKARTRGDVALKVFRAGASHEFRLPVAAAEGPEGHGLGITVGPGVVVAGVVPDGPAAAAGLATGDVIDELNGKQVHSSDGLRHAVHHLFDGEEAVLRVTRAGEVREVRARLTADAPAA